MAYRITSMGIGLGAAAQRFREVRRTTGTFVGLVRQLPSGEWRAEGQNFATLQEAADRVWEARS